MSDLADHPRVQEAITIFDCLIEELHECVGGIPTHRDMFAAAAFIGIAGNPSYAAHSLQGICDMAIICADALLAAIDAPKPAAPPAAPTIIVTRARWAAMLACRESLRQLLAGPGRQPNPLQVWADAAAALSAAVGTMEAKS